MSHVTHVKKSELVTSQMPSHELFVRGIWMSSCNRKWVMSYVFTDMNEFRHTSHAWVGDIFYCFMRISRFLDTCKYICHGSFMCGHDSVICVAWLIHMCDMWRDSFIFVSTSVVTHLFHMYELRRTRKIVILYDSFISYVRLVGSLKT